MKKGERERLRERDIVRYKRWGEGRTQPRQTERQTDERYVGKNISEAEEKQTRDGHKRTQSPQRRTELHKHEIGGVEHAVEAEEQRENGRGEEKERAEQEKQWTECLLETDYSADPLSDPGAGV